VASTSARPSTASSCLGSPSWVQTQPTAIVEKLLQGGLAKMMSGRQGTAASTTATSPMWMCASASNGVLFVVSRAASVAVMESHVLRAASAELSARAAGIEER
jgi:hypothetical protein